MNFVFSYDLGIEAGARRNEIENKIIECLPQDKFTRQLNNFFIVQVDDSTKWNEILDKLTSLSKSIPETFYFIMSPPMDESSDKKYNGMLPSDRWTVINKLTTK